VVRSLSIWEKKGRSSSLCHKKGRGRIRREGVDFPAGEGEEQRKRGTRSIYLSTGREGGKKEGKKGFPSPIQKKERLLGEGGETRIASPLKRGKRKKNPFPEGSSKKKEPEKRKFGLGRCGKKGERGGICFSQKEKRKEGGGQAAGKKKAHEEGSAIGNLREGYPAALTRKGGDIFLESLKRCFPYPTCGPEKEGRPRAKNHFPSSRGPVQRGGALIERKKKTRPSQRFFGACAEEGKKKRRLFQRRALIQLEKGK